MFFCCCCFCSVSEVGAYLFRCVHAPLSPLYLSVKMFGTGYSAQGKLVQSRGKGTGACRSMHISGALQTRGPVPPGCSPYWVVARCLGNKSVPYSAWSGNVWTGRPIITILRQENGNSAKWRSYASVAHTRGIARWEEDWSNGLIGLMTNGLV